MIRKYPNGATQYTEGILHRKMSKPAELKHLSKAEEKKTKVIPRVVASEMGGAQTCIVSAMQGL